MELEKLEIAQLGAHLPRERPAVAGRHQRIGGDGVELAHTAGREHDIGRRNFLISEPARATTPVTVWPS